MSHYQVERIWNAAESQRFCGIDRTSDRSTKGRMSVAAKLTGTQLRAKVLEVVTEAQERIATGDAAEEYGDEEDIQKFEKMDMDELIDYYREEFLDVINYAVMSVVRLDSLKSNLNRALDQLANVRWAFEGTLKDANRESNP